MDLAPVLVTAPKDDGCPAEEAVRLAEALVRESQEQATATEAATMRTVAGLIGDPAAKRLSLLMTDGVGRSRDAARNARLWRRWIREAWPLEGMSPKDRLLLRIGGAVSRWLPGPVMEAVGERLRRESRGVILPAEEAAITRYLQQRRRSGARVNLNPLGEAVLGEAEASRRLDTLLGMLRRPDVDYVSVKISSIFSQIDLTAWDRTLETLKERLRVLYRTAAEQGKFVNLDMEEYRDLELTWCAFRDVLSEEPFRSLSAGIVLQAYLPDSFGVQRKLTAWARDRVASGGAPIKLRLVKGANLAMERVEAEWHGWRAAPHPSKHETDAAFKRMMVYAVQPENACAVRLGVGSHNVFDVALALVLREQHGVAEQVEIEMLEGMAPAQSRVVQARAGGLLLYAPVVRKEDYGSALAYLVRRLDENTARGNFLASLFSLVPGSPVWKQQRDGFLSAWHARDRVPTESRRDLPLDRGRSDAGFVNEPDSDWTRETARIQLAEAVAEVEVPPAAGTREIDEALTRATTAQPAWEARPEAERAALLRCCAAQLAGERFQAIALLREEGKKAPAEADAEVSEAIDFARYYAETGCSAEGIVSEALGTVVVAPPWNFPMAIPCGGVLAALMAGNAVVLKPAPESVRCGWWLVRQLWAAGVPREVLHFIACQDGPTGRGLIEDVRVRAVILTGSHETARRFQKWRPSLPLFAETSGKNALVVSALADRELAVRDLVRSAFGHAGQKCSAASLGILEAEVYDDEVFRRQLCDAAASLPVGAASEPGSVVTPLVQPPGDHLKRALTTLEEGESWLLEPRVAEDDPCLWSPGIKLGIRPGSWFHQTECFGPVLGLMKAADLDEATDFQNAVPFGLTAGFHSLDEAEVARWKDRVEAGNLYVNRGITGAIVQRQPFGGWKRSVIGPGSKAGGPNYVNLFRRSRDLRDGGVEGARESYRRAWREHFSIEHDPSGLRCERNVFRYRPVRGAMVRLERRDETGEALLHLAAETCGVPLFVSRAWEESDAELVGRLDGLATRCEFFRSVHGPPVDKVLGTVQEKGLNWIDAPVSGVGRLELTRWMREQTVCETRHRYGNVLDANP